MLGILTGDVLIVAHWRLSTLIQYLTWFGKSPTSTGEVDIIRDREREQYRYMEEEDYIHSTLLPLLSHTATQGSRVAALDSHSFFSLPLFTVSLSQLILLSNLCLYL